MIVLKSYDPKSVSSRKEPSLEVAQLLYNASLLESYPSIQDVITQNVIPVEDFGNDAPYCCHYALNSNKKLGSAVIVSRDYQTIAFVWKDDFVGVLVQNPTIQTLRKTESFADELVIEARNKVYKGKRSADFITGYLDGHSGKPPRK